MDRVLEERRGLNLFRSTPFESQQAQLGFRIRMERLESGWTQEELARQVGIQSHQISRIERGLCFPHLNTIRRFENVFGFEISKDLPPRQKVQKVEIAQGTSIRSREPEVG